MKIPGLASSLWLVLAQHSRQNNILAFNAVDGMLAELSEKALKPVTKVRRVRTIFSPGLLQKVVLTRP